MLGMHGTVFANFAVDEADLLLAFGVRFDDRVTGKLETFASKARVVHIDIDPAEISKNKEAHIMVCADTRPAIRGQHSPCCLSVCQLSYFYCCTLQKDVKWHSVQQRGQSGACQHVLSRSTSEAPDQSCAHGCKLCHNH